MTQPVGWKIIGQKHVEKYMGGGDFEPVFTVQYETASGTKGSVDFPEGQYTRESVVTRLNELVGRIHEVAALDGLS